MIRTLKTAPGSSLISVVHYDDESQTMDVTFVSSGDTYRATGVPKSIADELEMPGISAGKIWHAKLKSPNFTWAPV